MSNQLTKSAGKNIVSTETSRDGVAYMTAATALIMAAVKLVTEVKPLLKQVTDNYHEYRMAKLGLERGREDDQIIEVQDFVVPESES